MTSPQASGWIFRWANPAGGNHIADLQALITGGEITLYSDGGWYNLSSDASYTYVNVVPVPEPSALLLTVAATGLLTARLRRRTIQIATSQC